MKKGENNNLSFHVDIKEIKTTYCIKGQRLNFHATTTTTMSGRCNDKAHKI